jgi:hypothetical protein
MDVFENAETIYLTEILKIVNYHLIDGTDHLWGCFGANARYMDFFEGDEKHFSVIFDTLTQRVYQVMVSDHKNDYVWIDPHYKRYYEDEAEFRGLDPYQVYDGLTYTVVEEAKDIKKKAYAIVNGHSYDERVSVSVELDEELLFHLMLEAHKLDITFNEYVERVLKNILEKQDV